MPKLFSIPPLENGDHLNGHEFERRSQAMRSLKQAELIEGVVYLPAALRFRSHGQPHAYLMTWLGVYSAATPQVALADNTTIRLDLDNRPQPDAVLLIEESAGGQARISDDDYIEGAPELIAEVAASSATIDLHDKKRAYRRNGVREYLVWQVYEGKLDWFSLQQGEYVLLPLEDNHIIRSQVFPGLWLAVNDLLAGNMTRVLEVLQAGLASVEYAAFVQS